MFLKRQMRSLRRFGMERVKLRSRVPERTIRIDQTDNPRALPQIEAARNFISHCCLSLCHPTVALSAIFQLSAPNFEALEKR